jgi:MraZ protein
LTFRGTYEHSLDAKHRLTVPAKFRATLADGVVLAISPEIETGATRSIAIWTADAYDAYTASALNSLNPLAPQARQLKRALFNNSFDTELDSANRVMIPNRFLSYAGIGKDVVVTGSGECLEVWDRATYEAYNEDVLSRFPEIAASLGHTT